MRLLAAAGALLMVATIGAAFVYLVSRHAVQVRVDGRAGSVPRTARASNDRGAYLYATAARCAACHAADLGGGFVLHDPFIAVLFAPNLTRGNPPVGAGYTEGDFERAIRRGLRPDGVRLLMMPSWDYATMSDDDVASVIAYIRSAKAVERSAPPFQLGPLGRVMLLTGQLDFDSDRIPETTPRDRGLPEGAYLARLGGCLRCHGAADRSPGNVGFAAFAGVLQTGRDAAGHAISKHTAPAHRWRDADVDALYRYFRR